MSELIFNSLNPQQIEAVKYTTGPSIILAGAGSGKTRVLVQKVLYLIFEKKVSPLNILMITFTNKAAAEMKERVKTRLGFIGTFHGLCASILRRKGENIGIGPDFLIYDADDQLSAIKQILKEIGDDRYTPGYYINRISAAKNQLISPKQYLKLFSDYNATKVAEVYEKYEKVLNRNHSLDFDDLIMKVVQMLIKFPEILEYFQNRFRYILVDEFQDTNYAQYTLTRLLAQRDKNITAVGDFSQSIYSWRGADIKNLEKFKEDFEGTKMFYLEENYRSTQQILKFAYQVISKNQTHPILELFTNNSQGEEVEFLDHENEQYEALFLAEKIKEFSGSFPYSSFAILYRTNAQSRVIEEAFLHFGIPYVLIGGTRFYERREIKDIICMLRLLINPADSVAEERIQKLGKRRWSSYQNIQKELKENVKTKQTNELMEEVFNATGYLSMYNPDIEEDYARLENIKELRSVGQTFPNLVEFLEQIALVESEYSEDEKMGKNKDGVRLMTLHQAKGLEFPYVFIVGVEEGILPHSRSIDDIYSLEEERRLFYVGITRAKKKLFITYARRRFIFGRRGESVKSRFIDDENEVF
jgi:DNA helicase II / ATP-dependent DNA helicase PcrA